MKNNSTTRRVHSQNRDLVMKQADEIEYLQSSVKILKDHLDFLRSKVEEQQKDLEKKQKDLEIFSHAIIVMNEERNLKSFVPFSEISKN